MRRILIIVVVILAILVGWFLFKPSKPIRQKIAESKVIPKESKAHEKPLGSESNQVFTPVPPKSIQRQQDEIRQALEQMNVPIEFWGKVVDQDDKPLEGVKIKTRVQVVKMPMLPAGSLVVPRMGTAEYKKIEATTDPSGSFKIENMKGSHLTLESIEKEGYELSKREGKSFNYHSGLPSQDFVPDRQNPIVYRMWKKGELEVLVHLDKYFGIPYDGTSVMFDLVQGCEVSSGGDLKVTLLRTPQQIKWGDNNYSWEATVEAVEGGLVLSEDEFMYQAPADGYQPSFKVGAKLGEPKWSGMKTVSFYLKSRGRKYYSRILIELVTNYDKPKTPLKIVSYLNPMGSRNLEYDFNKRIDPNYIQRVGLEKAIEEVKGR